MSYRQSESYEIGGAEKIIEVKGEIAGEVNLNNSFRVTCRIRD